MFPAMFSSSSSTDQQIGRLAKLLERMANSFLEKRRQYMGRVLSTREASPIYTLSNICARPALHHALAVSCHTLISSTIQGEHQAVHAHDVVICCMLVLLACAQDDSCLFALLMEGSPSLTLKDLVACVLDMYPKETLALYASNKSDSIDGLQDLVAVLDNRYLSLECACMHLLPAQGVHAHVV